MEVKKKDMQKTGWKRCLEKEYCYREFNFNEMSGIVSLSHFKKIESPLTIHYEFGDTLIADNNYKYLQFAFREKNFWLTAMYDDKDTLIELYFDITKGNYFDELSNPYFYDLFLDVVVTNSREIYIVDRDELDDAMVENVITEEEYNMAIKTADSLCRYLSLNKEMVIELCYGMLLEMKEKFRSNIN